MEELNMNKILNREENYLSIKTTLLSFEKNKNEVLFKKGIYVYGNPGSGKTTFVNNILKELNYDIVKYDTCDNRNTSVIEDMAHHNMSDKNIMSVFNKQIKKIAIIMDEIDGMNNGDKGGINTLIKLIRPKKTKKQKTEENTMNPVICIGNYHVDKKIKELMKVCNTIELKMPTNIQIRSIINTTILTNDESLKQDIVMFVQNDLRKLNSIIEIYKNENTILDGDVLKKIFSVKSYNDDTKKITQKLINNYYPIEQHSTIMNETDRTIVGLLLHENIIDVLEKYNKSISIPFYLQVLDNICFADYIDRITFQKQIWKFNELSSLIKTFKNNKLYNNAFKKKPKYNPTEVRFTKVLTKYSTEYNNSLFIQNLCQQLSMDQKDIFSFFLDLKKKYNDVEIANLFENYEITKLDINRIYRYLEKYTKENVVEEEVVDDDKSIEST